MKTPVFICALGLCAALLFPGCKKDEVDNSELTEKIYVANEGSDFISVIDATTNRPAKEITVDDGSGNLMMVHNIQASPDGRTVWGTVNPMATGATEKVIVIDPLTDVVTRWIDIGVGMHLAHVVLDSASRYAYVSATDSNTVYEIDAQSFAVTRTFRLGAGHGPHGMRYSRGKLYVSCMNSFTLSVVTLSDGTIQDIPVGGIAVQTAITPNGNYVFASLYDTKEVVRYEPATGNVVHFPLPSTAVGPVQLYPTPDGTRLFICDQGVLLGRPVSDKVFVMSTANGSILQTIVAGDATHGVVINRAGDRAYVTNSQDHTITVINANDYSVIATIPVGQNPNGISYWSREGGQP